MTAPTLLYNPGLASAEEIRASFVARKRPLAELLRLLESAPPEHAPQHALILGWRGMGKTTLLYRLAIAAEDDPALRNAWQPLFFPEEQYNIGGLEDLWLNALEVLAATRGEPKWRAIADDLARRYEGSALEEAARRALSEASNSLNRRLLFLVDNLDLVLERLRKTEDDRLREVLQHEPWLMIVGTSARAIESTFMYDKPFYEQFRVIELPPLDEEETVELLSVLAEQSGAANVRQMIQERSERLSKLRLLMGGNPRTIRLLFELLREGPAGSMCDHLEKLLDAHTSLYKERLEQLPAQSQRVFDALAQHWDPATAEQLGDALHLDRGPVSAQLHRLVDRGLVEKVDLPGRALGFQIRERFFNIWCLMRSGRRSRQRLRWLIEFIDAFYDDDRRRAEAVDVISLLERSPEGFSRQRLAEHLDAIAHTLPDDAAAWLYARALSARIAPADLSFDIDRVQSLSVHYHSVADALRAAGLPSAGDLAEAAVDLWTKGRLDEALESYQKAAELAPKTAEIWRNFGLMALMARRFDQAESALSHCASLVAPGVDVLHGLGIIAGTRGEDERARELFIQAADVDPTDGHMLGNLVLAELRRGAARESVLHELSARLHAVRKNAWAPADSVSRHGLAPDARPLFAQHHEQQGSSDSRAALGVIEVAMGNAGSGLVLLTQEHDEPLPVVDEWRGRAFSSLQRPSEAIEAFTSALSRLPASAELHARLAHELEGVSRIEDAEREIGVALHLDPKNAVVRSSLSNVLAARHRWAEVISILEEDIADGHTDAVTFTRLAGALGKAGRHGAAIDAAKQAVERGALDASTWGNLAFGLALEQRASEISKFSLPPPEAMGAAGLWIGTCLMAIADERAGSYLDAALPHLQDGPRLAQLGSAYARIKRSDHAAAAFRRAIAAGLDEPKTLRDALIVLRNHAGVLESLDAAGVAVERAPTDPTLWLMRAQLAREAGAWVLAQESIDQARRHGADDQHVVNEQVVLFDAQGRYEDALGEIDAQHSHHPQLPTLKSFLLQKLGRGRESLEAADAGLAEYPDNEGLVVMKAVALVLLARPEEALGELEGSKARSPNAALVRARALADVDRASEAVQVLCSLGDLEPSLVGTIAEIAPHIASLADDEDALRLRTLIGDIAKRVHTTRIHGALARLDARLGRVKQGAEQFRIALDLAREHEAPEHGDDLLEAGLALARAGGAAEVRAVLEEANVTERWRPLYYALVVLTGSGIDILSKLSPEMRAVTEDVLIRIGRRHIAVAALQALPGHLQVSPTERLIELARRRSEFPIPVDLWEQTTALVQRAVSNAADVDVVRFEDDIVNRVLAQLPVIGTRPAWAMESIRELIGRERATAIWGEALTRAR